MKHFCPAQLAVVLIVLLAVPALGAPTIAPPGPFVVRISDLQYSPTPPNPIKVVGRVTSVSPLKLSDGRGEIAVSGIAANVGDVLVLQGSWDGSVLTPDSASSQEAYTSRPVVTEMVYVPDGTFLMGNSGAGEDRWAGYFEEYPQHSVDLAGYWMAKYEVTRGEYRQFMEAGGYFNPAYWSADGWAWRTSSSITQPVFWTPAQNWGTGTFTQTDSFPVVGVSYYEAEAYCAWADGHLPTEAQWEKAARWDGHPRLYPWGDTWDPEKCNNYYDSNPAGGGYAVTQTSPVGSYPAGASPYGCMDMAGNVWEWCQDWFSSYPGYAYPFDYTGSYRVLRGRDWDAGYGYLYRCALRNCAPPEVNWYYYGFRLVR